MSGNKNSGRKPKPEFVRTSVFISKKSREYLREQGMSETVERLTRAEMNERRLLKIAEQMHSELCGCDDKTCTLTDEIYDWLYNGDAQNLTEADVPELVKEWKEYGGE